MMKNKGFSLVELIIVIAIIAILAGLIAPAAIHYIDKGRVSKQETNVRNIYTSAQAELIGYFTVNSDFLDSSSLYYGAEAGKATFIDSVTGNVCGRISSLSFGGIRDGSYSSLDPREEELANSIYDSSCSSINFDKVDPSGKLVSSLTSSKVSMMIIYDEDGIVRIEYSHKGFYTVYDGKDMTTVKINSDGNENSSFSVVN